MSRNQDFELKLKGLEYENLDVVSERKRENIGFVYTGFIMFSLFLSFMMKREEEKARILAQNQICLAHLDLLHND